MPADAVLAAVPRRITAARLLALPFNRRALLEAAGHGEALAAYRAGADFADALIARTNTAMGCTKTLTFDRKAAKRIIGFEFL